MAETLYPPPFDLRVLAGEVPVAPPASASLVAPTITTVARPFTLHLALADAQGYPAAPPDGGVTVRAPFASPAEIHVPFAPGAPAAATITGVTIAKGGLYRFSVELNGRTFHGNPTCCGEAERPGIYWGDPHVHTVLSDCHADKCRSLAFCYAAARYFSCLDWAAAADHVSNGRCELARWKEQVALCNAYDDPPAFVTLPAYEASFKGGAGGDNNFYMLRHPDLFVDGYDDGTVKTVCERLAETLEPGEFFAVPHHTTRTGKHGEIGDEIYPGPDWMPVVEIHSKWGTSEYRGNPNPLKKIHPGPSYVVDLLNRGLKLGFIGGTDTHATMPAGYGYEHLDRPPGMTAVIAERLTRESIYHGIRGRRCYAASAERIYLDAAVAGAKGGRTLRAADVPGPRRITLTAAGQSDIATVEVVRNGQTLHSQPAAAWHAAAEYTDADDLDAVALESPHLGRFVYYYTRVTCTSGAQAWSSPVWIVMD